MLAGLLMLEYARENRVPRTAHTASTALSTHYPALYQVVSPLVHRYFGKFKVVWFQGCIVVLDEPHVQTIPRL